MQSDLRHSLLLTASQQTMSTRALVDWASDHSLPDDHFIKPSEKIMSMMEEENVCQESLALQHCSRLCGAYCALGDKQAITYWAKKGAAIAAIFDEDISPWVKVLNPPGKSPLWGLRTISAR